MALIGPAKRRGQRDQPVNYRLYDKAEGKTKTYSFQDRFADVLVWGLEPAVVTGDSGVDNLKRVRPHSLGFLFALESNRRVAVEPGSWTHVQHLEIRDNGLKVWRCGFGPVKGVRTRVKEQPRPCAVHRPDGTSLAAFGQEAFQQWPHQHWQIEHSHRLLKQVCHVDHF